MPDSPLERLVRWAALGLLIVVVAARAAGLV
jgi:hypothetical protein